MFNFLSWLVRSCVHVRPVSMAKLCHFHESAKPLLLKSIYSLPHAMPEWQKWLCVA